MSRQLYFNFRAPDSTLLFNDRLRAILREGVYAGFDVAIGGSAGLFLKFTHDADPGKTGEVLGKLITKDGVIIEENADQDDVVVGSLSAGTPNIHYVVASYVYNQALPNNDVVYTVKQGTSGAPPTPPTLTDDEVKIAEIDVPGGAIDYTSSGVDIKTVAKQDLYGDITKIVRDSLPGMLDPGIYDGLEASEGSTSLDVSLAAGTFVSQENVRVVQAAAQPDLFAITDPAAGNYRLAWVVAMHKDEDLDPAPTPDYLLVEGSAVAVGSVATLPLDATILAAAAVVDAKYDDNSYINKLGYIRVENRAGTYYIDYVKGETILDDHTIRVYGGQADSFDRSGKYFGFEGLQQAIADIYALTATRLDLERPYTLLLDGDFQTFDSPLHIPSYVRLRGLGAGVKISSEIATDVVRVHGKEIEWDAANDVIAVPGAGASTPPAGFDAKTFAIQATYQTGDDLETLMISAGDVLYFWSEAQTTVYVGQIVEVTGAWTFEAWTPTQYGVDGDPEDLDVLILKREVHLENLEITRINAGSGQLSMRYLERCGVDNVRCYDYEQAIVRNSRFGRFNVENDLSWGVLSIWPTTATSDDVKSENNHYEFIHLEGSGDDDIFTNDRKISVGTILKETDDVRLNGDGIVVRAIIGDLTLIGTNLLVVFVASTITDGAASDADFRVLHALTTDNQHEYNEHSNQDRNLRLVSDASISWDSASGTLSWDDDIFFDLAYTTGYNRIQSSQSPKFLTVDGDRVYIDLDRTATGTVNVVPSVQSKASAANSNKQPHRILFAVRKGTVIQLWDGTRIENGQTVQIGATPPPDGSVTYVKLASDATAFHNKFFRDYISVEDNDGWDNDVLFRNTALQTMAYTTGTGVLQFSGAVDLAAAETAFAAGIPLVVILRNVDFAPGSVGQRAYTREAIVAISDASDTITIDKGLDITPGVANIWNGAVARGNMAVTNDDLVSFTYDPQGTNPGRITYASGLDFSQQQVRVGYIFVDNSGVKYRIRALDTSGNGDWIEIHPGLRDVDDGTPTTKFGGSIETNNNPYSNNFADLRPLIGAEFIPIDIFGEMDTRDGEELVRDGLDIFDGMERRIITPFDDRIRVYTKAATADGEDEPVYDNADRVGYGSGQIEIVEFTGVCTGAALVLGNGGSAVAEQVHLDGEVDTSDWDYLVKTDDSDQAYGMDHYQYEVVHSARLMRLPQGIHHIRWTIDPNAQVRGVYVWNATNLPAVREIADSPGQLVRAGGVVTFADPKQDADTLPDPGGSPVWNKGARSIRYVNTSNVQTWISTFVRNTTGTGDTNGTTLIGTVSNITDWRVGDIVMLIDSNIKYLRRITSISGTAMTIDSAVPFTTVGAILRYYGHVYQQPSDDRNHDRRSEERAAVMPIMEFCTMGGALSDNRSAVGKDGVARTTRITIRASDGQTVFTNETAGVKNRAGGRIFIDAVSTVIRFWFVGTGLSIQRTTAGGFPLLTLVVDGVSCPDIVNSSTDVDDDPGGTFICGELPYGVHTVELTTEGGGASDFELAGITIWQPKKPTFTGFELLDINMVADSEASLGIDSVASMALGQFGTISYEAGPFAHFTGSGTWTDVGVGANFAVNGRQYVDSTPGLNDDVFWTFYGDEITFVHGTIVLGGGNPMEVAFLDHDGQFKAPSALTGFSVTSSAGDTWPASAVFGDRKRYVLDKLGVHVVRIRHANGGADGIEFDAIEIHCPVHNHKAKMPVGIDHMMPLQHAGVDKRNLVPFDASLLPPGQIEHVQGAWLNQVVATLNNQAAFVFYTRGGLTEISVAANVTDAGGGGGDFQIAIDGLADGPFFSMPSNIPAAGDTTIVASRMVALYPGFHFAFLEGTTADSVQHTSWRTRNVGSVPATQLLSRGLGTPILGPVGAGEAGF
jgi:hypothetical protein